MSIGDPNGPPRGYIPTEETAIEEGRDAWMKLYRERIDAGREVPIVDVPRSLGDVARTSVEATDDLARRARARSYTVNIDLRRARPPSKGVTTGESNDPDEGRVNYLVQKRAAALRGWETRRRNAAARAAGRM